MANALKFWMAKQLVEIGLVVAALAVILLVAVVQGTRLHWRESRRRRDDA